MCENRNVCQTREMNELIQVIRSIIESNGNRLSIRSLLREYKNTENSDLPFNRFGYDSPLELLKDFVDDFGVEIDDKHRYESDYVVYCVANDNTRHIVDLVQNQRHSEEPNIDVIQPMISVFGKTYANNNPRQKTVKPFKLIPNYTKEDTESNADINCRQNSNFQRKRNEKIVRKSVCPLPDSRVITIGEKNKILDLMRKYPSLNLLNFEAIYRVFHKQDIDYKSFGFTALHHFLQQMPNIVSLVPFDDGIRVVSVECNGTQPNGQHNGFNDGLNKRVTNHSINGLTKTNGYKQNHFLSPKDNEEFLTILRRYPNGIPVHQFISDYYKSFGKPFLSDVWGFGSPIEMFSSMSDIFYLVPNDKTLNMEEWFIRESTPGLKPQTRVFSQKKISFDRKLKDNINEMMVKIEKTSQSKSLFVSDFSDAYYLCFHQNIDPNNYGFDNIRQLLNNLSKECNFEVKEEIKGNPFIVYRNKSSFN